MTQEITEVPIGEDHRPDAADALPFPFQKRTFCRYEPIAQRIEKARVLVVDNLLRDVGDLSAVARLEWGDAAPVQLKRERQIADMAIENILNNIARLIKDPSTQVTHISKL